jgi:UDP-N-acetylmuramyl pentapeptide phosphotransferase/UDP-N-acetylglucosamine-1-phosphate transferase
MKPVEQPNLFPSFDSIEAVLWPAATIAVFVITAVLVDLMVILAARWRLVDLPNRRSAHALPTARGGGLAIVVTTALASLLVALRWPPAAFAILVGVILPCLVIAVVGIIDDMQPLRASLRLVVQIGVAAAITAALGPLSSIAIPGLPVIELGWVGWPLTVLWIVGMTNAFNFMDGSDGMAALGAVVAGGAIAVIGWQLRIHLPLLLAAFAAAAAGGFLVFNWQPARVFMGDVGSAFLGTYLAAVPLTFPEPQRSLVFIPMVLALWPYVFDPFVSVLRRVYHRKNPFEPHREFLFHRLIRSGIPHGRTAIVYALLAGIGGCVGILMVVNVLPEAVRAYGPLLVIALAGGLAFGIERRCMLVGLPSAAGPTAPPPAADAAAAAAPPVTSS